MTIFSKNLRRVRDGKGWTQGRAAKKIGVKRATYAAYEEGRSLPRALVFVKLMRVYDIIDLSFVDSEEFKMN